MGLLFYDIVLHVTLLADMLRHSCNMLSAFVIRHRTFLDMLNYTMTRHMTFSHVTWLCDTLHEY